MGSKTKKTPSAGLVLVKDGDTKIHRHPRKQEIADLIAEYFHLPVKDRPVKRTDFVQYLNTTFGADLSLDDVKNFARTYLPGATGLNAEIVHRRLREAEVDLISAERHLTMAERLSGLTDDALELFQEHRRKVLNGEYPVDENGKIILPPGHGDLLMSPAQIASLARASADLRAMGDEELERWGIIPARKQQVEVTKLNVDVDRIMGNMMGPRPEEGQRRKEPQSELIDVDWSHVDGSMDDDEEPTS